MASLDKYQFVEGRQESGKKRDKKHKKRSKKRGVASSSSDEVRPIKGHIFVVRNVPFYMLVFQFSLSDYYCAS